VPTDGIRAANMGDRDFGTSPIFGQLSGKPLLASTKHLGCREVKHNGVSDIEADQGAISFGAGVAPACEARNCGGAPNKSR
jgi:hypothetical protein